jgi:hypothetical protein
VIVALFFKREEGRFVLVKMLVNVGSCRRGQVVRVAQRVASTWCENGQAVPVCQLDSPVNMEIAVAPPVDSSGNHTEKVPRKRRRKRRKN